jgi:hypothetical protein
VVFHVRWHLSAPDHLSGVRLSRVLQFAPCLLFLPFFSLFFVGSVSRSGAAPVVDETVASTFCTLVFVFVCLCADLVAPPSPLYVEVVVALRSFSPSCVVCYALRTEVVCVFGSNLTYVL